MNDSTAYTIDIALNAPFIAYLAEVFGKDVSTATQTVLAHEFGHALVLTMFYNPTTAACSDVNTVMEGDTGILLPCGYTGPQQPCDGTALAQAIPVSEGPYCPCSGTSCQ